MPVTDVSLQVDDGTGLAVALRRQDFGTGVTGAASQVTLAQLLAAVQAQVATGTVALDAATLAALEQVSVTVTGTVATGGLTDTQLRAAALAVTGPQTDAQARATAQPVAVASFPSIQAVSGTVAVTGSDDARFAGGKQAASAQVTALGDTTVLTPSLNKSLRVFWVSAFNDPNAATSARIIIKFGTTELYRAPVVSHWEIFQGSVNQSLVVNLDAAANVAVSVHYAEV